MNQLAHLTHLALDDLPLAHRLALAAGAGVWLTGEDERISTAHELVALAVPALVRLPNDRAAGGCRRPSRWRAKASWRSSRPGRCACLTGRSPSHGRDHGYLTDAWCAARPRRRAPGHPRSSDAKVPSGRASMTPRCALGQVVGGLHRDRLAVPENLADAIGALLVVYLAARPT